MNERGSSRHFPSRQELKKTQLKRESASHSRGVTPLRRSRVERRRSARARIKRWWIEALVLVVLAAIVGTAILVAVNRKNDAQPPRNWLERIQVSGNVGRVPILKLSEPVSVSETKTKLLERGGGRQITKGAPLLVSITSFSGENGHVLSTNQRSTFDVGPAETQSFEPELLDGVIGKTEGSRVLFVRPVTNKGQRTTEINVVDILPSVAWGDAVKDPGKPLKVTMTEAGPRPSHDGQKPPADLTVQTLVTGGGQQVRADDTVLVQYLAARWDDSVEISSTWATGIPKMIPLRTAMAGVEQALLDQRVGTRLAITIPPDQASGDSTLMVIIDILATRQTDEAEVKPDKK